METKQDEKKQAQILSSPSATDSYLPGRSPDSRVGIPGIAPSHAMHSGSEALPLLVYRCGGSAGIDAVVSSHRLPVSPQCLDLSLGHLKTPTKVTIIQIFVKESICSDGTEWLLLVVINTCVNSTRTYEFIWNFSERKQFQGFWKGSDQFE